MKKIKAIWWVIIGAKKFRVKYYKDGKITRLMTYVQADSYASIFGGDVFADHDTKF